MRKRLFLIAILILISILLAAAPKTDWQTDQILGKVKCLKMDYAAFNYNAQGYRQSIIYGGSDNYSGDTMYTYDSSNHLLSSVSHNAYHEENGRITYTYDSSGLLLTMVSKGTDDDETKKYEYNGKQQLVWIKTYDSDNELSQADEYLYSAGGNNYRINNYNGDMELYYYTLCVFDKANNKVEVQEYDAFIPEEPERVLRYDTAGLLTEEIAFYVGQFDYHKLYYYDSKSNCIKEETYFEDGEIIETCTYTYTFDKQGNWLTKIEKIDGEEIENETRIITYY